MMAYEMRISDLSSDVCSADLLDTLAVGLGALATIVALRRFAPKLPGFLIAIVLSAIVVHLLGLPVDTIGTRFPDIPSGLPAPHFPTFSMATVQQVLPSAFTIAFLAGIEALRSEEHTSELQSLMRISYAVFCLKKKKT